MVNQESDQININNFQNKTNECKHYKQNGLGERCKNRVDLSNEGYCKKHRKKDIDNDITSLLSTSPNNTYSFDTIINKASYRPTNLDTILRTIVPYNQLSKTLGVTRHKNKREAAQHTAHLIECMWLMRSNNTYIRAIIWFQRLFRLVRSSVKDIKEKLEGLQGPELQEQINPDNECDPFTLEPVSTLSEKNKFVYKDSANRLWAFNLQQLRYYATLIRDKEKEKDKDGTACIVNPFTRETIPADDVERLFNSNLTKVEKTGEVTKDDTNEEEEKTIDIKVIGPHDAFMMALYEIDSIGFYSKIEWFLTLTPENIVDLVTQYEQINRSGTDRFVHTNNPITLDLIYQSISREENLLTAFAHLIRNAIKGCEQSRKFALICNILVALSSVNHRIKRELPSWIYRN